MHNTAPEAVIPDPTHLENIMYGVEGISQAIRRAGVFKQPHFPHRIDMGLVYDVASVSVATPYQQSIVEPPLRAARMVRTAGVEVSIDRRWKRGSVNIYLAGSEPAAKVPVYLAARAIRTELGSLSDEDRANTLYGMPPLEAAIASIAMAPYAAFIDPDLTLPDSSAPYHRR